MQQRIVAIVALLTITLLANQGTINPVRAYPVTGEPDERIENAAQNSNSSIERGKFLMKLLVSGMLLATGMAASRVSKASKTADFKPVARDKPEIAKESSKAITLNKSDNSPPIEQINKQFKRGDGSKAIEDLNEVIELNPRKAQHYSERANLRKKLGDTQGAIEDYTQAIRLNPQNALLYLRRSQTHTALGNRQKAIEDYNEAIRLAPEDTIYYYSQETYNFRH